MTDIKEFKIEHVPISKIQLDLDNPNEMSEEQFNSLKEAMKKFGYLTPIVLDQDYKIADGEHRYLVYKELGRETIPAYVLDLRDTDRRLLRQIMNKVKGTHDPKLDEEEFKRLLKELTADEINIFLPEEDLSGFFEKRKEDFDTGNALTREPKYKVTRGDVWQLGNHKLMCGDSTIEEDVKKLVKEEKPILMVTDPPYGVNYDPKWRDEADKKGILGNRYPTRSLGAVQNDSKFDWSEAYTHFQGDVAYVYHAGKFASEVASTLEHTGFEIINQIIWVKPHFALSRGDYHWRHEPIWYAVKKGRPHNWQGSRTEQTVWEIAGMNAMGASTDEADEATGHGTQKPIECMKRPIINNSKEEEGVYDPFGGSGSTLIACEQTNRKCYMMEIDPRYCSVILERWEAYTNKQAEKL